MSRERRTLADAARAYCAERDAITALTRQVAALRCEAEEAAEPDVGFPGVPPCFAAITREEYMGGPVIDAPVPYWQATPEELAVRAVEVEPLVALLRDVRDETKDEMECRCNFDVAPLDRGLRWACAWCQICERIEAALKAHEEGTR